MTGLPAGSVTAGSVTAASGSPVPGSRAAAGGAPVPGDLQAYLDQQERDILVKVLAETGFNRTAAATRLGLSLRQIRYRIARLNIAMPSGEDPADDAA